MEVEEGYTFRNGKRIAFITEGQERYTRCDRVGDYYTEEMIRDRIANKEKYRDVDLSLRTRYKKKNIPEPEGAKEAVRKGSGTGRDSSGSGPAATSSGVQKKTGPEKEKHQKDSDTRKKTGPEKQKHQEDPGTRKKTDPEKEGHRTDPGSREGSKKAGRAVSPERSDGSRTCPKTKRHRAHRDTGMSRKRTT